MALRKNNEEAAIRIFRQVPIGRDSIGSNTEVTGIPFELMRHVLFICSRNQLRSPTAEQVFSKWPGIEVASAGLDKSSRAPVTPELLEWADLTLVMEPAHRTKLAKKFKSSLRHQRVVCLNIPDDYQYMDQRLVQLLEKVVPPHLGTQGPGRLDP